MAELLFFVLICMVLNILDVSMYHLVPLFGLIELPSSLSPKLLDLQPVSCIKCFAL